MELTVLKNNKIGVIEKLKGDSHFLSRIIGMGFTPGTKLKMIQNYGRKALIVFIRDTVITIERKEANNIILQEEC